MERLQPSLFVHGHRLTKHLFNCLGCSPVDGLLHRQTHKEGRIRLEDMCKCLHAVEGELADAILDHVRVLISCHCDDLSLVCLGFKFQCAAFYE